MYNAGLPGDWKKGLDDLVSRIESTLMHDREFMNHVFDPSEMDTVPLSTHDIFAMLVGEAEKTLAMIEPHLKKGMRLLEVGGGVGLVHALLRSRGFDIVSLEPGSEGFGDRHRAGMQVLELLEIDSNGWLRTGIEDLPLSIASFDMVFSYFVLEHVTSLDQAFRVMAKVLRPGGVMIHRCPNYTVPFEPHYNIPLLPLKPEWTHLIFPWLRNKGVWQGLQFTTKSSIKRLCLQNGLQPIFRKGMTAGAFEQVLADPLFRARKQGFVRLARVLEASGLLKVLGRLPSVIDTPMEFTAIKKSCVA